MISGKLLFNSDFLLFQTDSQAGMLLRFLSPICNFEALTQETGKERHGEAWRRCIGRTNRHDQLGSRRLGLALVVHLTDLPTIKLHQAKPPLWYLYFPTTFVIGSFNHNALAASEKKKDKSDKPSKLWDDSPGHRRKWASQPLYREAPLSPCTSAWNGENNDAFMDWQRPENSDPKMITKERDNRRGIMWWNQGTHLFQPTCLSR